jgi:hypothetical protein
MLIVQLPDFSIPLLEVVISISKLVRKNDGREEVEQINSTRNKRALTEILPFNTSTSGEYCVIS